MQILSPIRVHGGRTGAGKPDERAPRPLLRHGSLSAEEERVSLFFFQLQRRDTLVCLSSHPVSKGGHVDGPAVRQLTVVESSREVFRELSNPTLGLDTASRYSLGHLQR